MEWTEFRERVTDSLDSQELRTLCFDLNVDYDSLRGEAKADKIRELIALLRREARLPELAARLREIRPRTSWPDLASQLPDPDAPPDSSGDSFRRSAAGARPNWLVVGGIGLGLAGIVLIAVLVIAGGIGAPRAGVNASKSTVTPDEATASAGNDEPGVEPAPAESCLDQFFADIESERRIAIEVGERARDFVVASQDRTSAELSDPYGITLTRNGETVAALRFRFRAEGVLFKISSVVDADCQAISGYDDTLENWDKLEIPLDDSTLSLAFNFQRIHIRFNLREL